MKSKLFIAIVAVATALFASCEKEEFIREDVNLKEINTSTLKSATYYNTGWYRVNSVYKSAYVHKKQKTNECSWTSYILTTAAIVRGKGNLDYPYNGSYEDKISHCKTWCEQNPTSLGSSGITTIRNYCNTLDAPKYLINCSLRTTAKSDKTGAVQLMLEHISNNGTPFLYIGSVNGIGHYFIVWTIYWGGSLSSSTVYYTNTLDYPASNFDNQIKSQNLSDFLNSNIMQNNNMLFLY